MKSFQHLPAEAFRRALSQHRNAILLDVRTHEEFMKERIPHAINLDVTDAGFLQHLATLDKSRAYFIYCLSGGRSGHACALMSQQGFTVYNLAGGMMHWTGDIC